MNQTREKGGKANLEPDFILFAQICPQKVFSWVLLLLDVTWFSKLLLYAIPKKTNKPNLRILQKN